jgi:hypothetical protein
MTSPPFRVEQFVPSPYVSTNASSPIPLWSGLLWLDVGGARSVGNGDIALEWRPEPWIAWRQATPSVPGAVFNADSGRAIPHGLGTWAPYARTSATIGTGRRSEARGYLPDGLVVGRGPFNEITFHLVNFPDYVGSPISLGNADWVGRQRWTARGWSVVLDQVPNYTELKRQLRADRGFAVTHVGRVSRTDRTPVSARRALALMTHLHWFLAFVRGGWVGPALLIGNDTAGRTRWQHWSVLRVTPAASRHSWFDGEDPDAMARLAPGFMQRLESRTWGDPFARAIGFYVDGNQAVPIDIGIILAQAGLELLAWSVLVRSGRVAPSAYKRMSADESLRRLLRPTNMPMVTPPNLGALAGPLPGLGASSDVAERVAYVRNKIVHPPRNRRMAALPPQLIRETWLMSLHMLELALLHLAGFRGQMQSRVSGRRVAVPWT